MHGCCLLSPYRRHVTYASVMGGESIATRHSSGDSGSSQVSDFPQNLAPNFQNSSPTSVTATEQPEQNCPGLREHLPAPEGRGTLGLQTNYTAPVLDDWMDQNANQLSAFLRTTAFEGSFATLKENVADYDSLINTVDKFGRTILMYASMSDSVELCKWLIKHNAGVNKEDHEGRTALHWAVFKCSYKCVALLAKKGNCFAADVEGVTAIHLAARQSSPKCLEIILRFLPRNNLRYAMTLRDCNRRLPLHWAAASGNWKQLEILLQSSKLVTGDKHLDCDGRTELMWAAFSNEGESAVRCAKLITLTYPDTVSLSDNEGLTALHLGVVADSTLMVSFLVLQPNCPLNIGDKDGRTPLHWAAKLGHVGCLKVLLDSGASVFPKDIGGASPLHFAAQHNQQECVAVFLSIKSSAYLHDSDNDGRSPLMWAAVGGALDSLKLFLNNNANNSSNDSLAWHNVDCDGANALHLACGAGQVEIVQELLCRGWPANILDNKNSTPLFYAAKMGKASVVQLLLNSGCKITTMDLEGRTALHWSALGGHAYVCQILINGGINPDVMDLYGRTSAHCAAFSGYVACLSILVQSGGSPALDDGQRLTPLHMACREGHIDVVKLLLNFAVPINTLGWFDDSISKTALDFATELDDFKLSELLRCSGALTSAEFTENLLTPIVAACRGKLCRMKVNLSYRNKNTRQTNN